MGSRYRYFRNVWNSDFKHYQKGLHDIDLFDFFRFDDDRSYRIPVEHEYRPDLISLRFYGDPKLYWVLIYCNRFDSSPEDFNAGRVIRVPRFERVVAIS
ncbi:hypothetical protein CL614_00080 [archaeon]|nr:hypothetical protein [archaeon]|tara:strand:+ start:43 stop:339 length:297 start_codon:yes stop_codon:yes gene_type:complete